MYKVLVTTTFDPGSVGCSVHTLVLEFGNAGDARKAAEIINRSGKPRTSCYQSAACLFEDR